MLARKAPPLRCKFSLFSVNSGVQQQMRFSTKIIFELSFITIMIIHLILKSFITFLIVRYHLKNGKRS